MVSVRPVARKCCGRISLSGAGQAKRTASPLTPVLSPLRGEGARRAILEYRTSFPAFGEHVSARCPKAARVVEPPNTSAATPSPLKGERAGVRGEDSPDLPCNSLRCAPSHCGVRFAVAKGGLRG